jgi:hypothetical protein
VSPYEDLKAIHLRVGLAMRTGRKLSVAILKDVLLCYLPDDVTAKVGSAPALLDWDTGVCPFCFNLSRKEVPMNGGYHVFACPHLRKRCVGKKHDHIVEAIISLLHEAGAQGVREPKHISFGNKKIDIIVSQPLPNLGPVTIEVSSVLSTSPSYLSSNLRRSSVAVLLSSITSIPWKESFHRWEGF